MINPGFHEYFGHHPAFRRVGGIYFQQDLENTSDFEKAYLPIRLHEGRVYDDPTVAKLPIVPKDHPLRLEWMVRHQSTLKLVTHLRRSNPGKLLEIGCGNGWLTHYLHELLNVDCAGIDLNVRELEQAERVFGRKPDVNFVYGDVLSNSLKSPIADAIVVAGVIQYFPDLPALIIRLLQLLRPPGEIHILDSPLYTSGKALLARERSFDYFRKSGHENMIDHYHHHAWESLRGFSYDVLYDPNSWRSRLNRLYMTDSPFPWIRITHPEF